MTSRVPLARHPVSIAGALAIAAAFELFDNPYAGLVIFVAPLAVHADSLTLRCSRARPGRRVARPALLSAALFL